jgi:hypothetical protein
MQILSIGRDVNNNIVLNDNFVSRQHAHLLLQDNGKIIIKDLGSSNGTFVNGNKISECFLKSGDVLQCAKVSVNWQQYINTKKPDEKKYQAYQQQPPVQQEYQPQPETRFVEQPKQSIQPTVQQPTAQPQGYGQQNIIIIGKQKSVGVAFLLAFLFGPLGLLYASVTGGIIMFILGIVIGIITLGFGLIFIWVGCIIWAVIAAGAANKKMVNNSAPLIQNQY